MFGVPPFLLLVLCIPVAFIPRVGPLLALLLYLLAQPAFGLIPRSIRRMRSTSDDSARGLHWTVVCSI